MAFYVSPRGEIFTYKHADANTIILDNGTKLIAAQRTLFATAESAAAFSVFIKGTAGDVGRALKKHIEWLEALLQAQRKGRKQWTNNEQD